jgi:preprotein translocase subunit SecY
MRLSVVGAAYLSVVCLVPEFLSPIYGYSFLLGGTGVLIVVNVIIDTVINIQTSMLSAKYEKALKKYDKR